MLRVWGGQQLGTNNDACNFNEMRKMKGREAEKQGRIKAFRVRHNKAKTTAAPSGGAYVSVWWRHSLPLPPF